MRIGLITLLLLGQSMLSHAEAPAAKQKFDVDLSVFTFVLPLGMDLAQAQPEPTKVAFDIEPAAFAFLLPVGMETPAADAPAVEAKSSAPAPTAQPPRIDKKKPYMRVWYWPPMPQESASGEPGRVGAPGSDRIDPVHFPTNRSKVVDETEALNRLAGWMNANPGVKVSLDGYADPRGSKAKNKKLSEARAKAVRDFLVKAGVAENRIETASHGAASPVKGETNEETYWLSRRVSIRFSGLQAAPAVVPAKPTAPAPAAAAPVKNTVLNTASEPVHLGPSFNCGTGFHPFYPPGTTGRYPANRIVSLDAMDAYLWATASRRGTIFFASMHGEE